jgi:hypothetical protein
MKCRLIRNRGAFPICLLGVSVFVCGFGTSNDWRRLLGSPVIEAAFDKQSESLLRPALTRERMADEAQACAGFVNAYQLSGDARYKARANETADFLVANANLAGDGIPGWGQKLDVGYGFCADHDDFKGKDLWETTRALDCLLKVSEIEPSHSVYLDLARQVVDGWPSIERRLPNDGPYAAEGMRFYYKNAQSCARKYVKNTNIAMSQALFRLAHQSSQARYRELAQQTLNAEQWEILTRHNFGYHGAMIYVEPNDPQNQEVLKHERPRVVTDAQGNIVCRSQNPDSSCWNHLAFEAYALYQVQLLGGRDLSESIAKIMALYRTSPFGDTRRFDWAGKDTPTHITAYNCYLRNSGPTVYRDECIRALDHGTRGSMIFYSLVPDDLVGHRR